MSGSRTGTDLVAQLAAPAFLVDAGLAGMPIAAVNDAFTRLTGLANETVAGRPLVELLGSHASARDRAQLAALIEADTAFAIALDGDDGGTIWHGTLDLSPLAGGAGRWLGIVVPASQGEALAVSQLRHGYQNVLQSMTSLVSLQGRHAGTPDTARAMRDLATRLEALSGLYGMAGAGPGDLVDLGDILQGLAGRLSAVCDPDASHPIHVSAEPVRIARRAAGIVGQVIAELLLQACAATADPPRQLDMTLLARDGHAELTLTGAVAATHADGAAARLGATLTRALVRSLLGQLDEQTTDDARSWRLTWPL